MLLPTRATYRPGEPIDFELAPAPRPRQLTVSHLGRVRATVEVVAAADRATLHRAR